MTNEEFIGLIKRNPIRVIAVSLAVLSGVGIYLINDRIDTATTTLSQKVAEGDRLAANVKYAVQLPEQYDALAAANKAVQSRAVRASQLANNLQYFYRLETESGIELIDLRQTSAGTTAARPSLKGPANGVAFSVAVKGDYPAVLGWLRRVETGPHYSRVVSATMSTAGIDRSDPLVLNVALELFGQP